MILDNLEEGIVIFPKDQPETSYYNNFLLRTFSNSLSPSERKKLPQENLLERRMFEEYYEGRPQGSAGALS